MALGHYRMKHVRESIEDLVGAEKLASPALQSAYNKGFHAARSAAVEIIAQAEDQAAARPPINDPFPLALLSAVGSTTVGVVTGFAAVNLLKLHFGWIFGFSAVGAVIGVSIAALLLRDE